jgi:signal transduction histidine kinase
MSDPTHARPIYVLVVEDDRDDFFLTQDVLASVSEKKYAVAWAGSYEGGRTALFEQRFDVALVDYHIGERTGLEFIAEFGSRYPECPMILLTGVDNPDVDRAAEKAGAADFLVKDALSPDLLDRAIRYASQHAERKALLAAVLDNAGAGMVALNPDNKVLIWNREAVRALDLSDKPGVQAADIEHAVGALAVDGRLPQEYATRQADAFEIGVNDVPGGGHVLVFQDVTRRARTEQLLRQTAADAEAANVAKSSFLATMSHELRTPLNGILGMVRVLEATVADEAQLGYISTIKASSMSLLAIINDVLDLSKIEAGKFELDIKELELAPLVDEVVELLAPTAFDKGLDLAAFVAPDLPRTMRGDPVRLRQILTNLVGNAIKFTTEGAVTVRVFTEPADAQRLRFEVVDTGIGISAADRARLFQKFSQVDSSLARRSGGTGLGLAICRELMALMGGSIWCDSEIGRGSTFAITLPSGAENLAVTAAAKRRFAHLGQCRIMVLSESRAARDVLEAWTGSIGGSFVIAADEAQVLEAVKAGSIDALVVDRFGGVMPSAALQRLPRSLPAGSAMRFIMLSEDQLDGSSSGYRILPRPIVGRTLDVLASELKPRPSTPTTGAQPRAAKPGPAATRQLRILLAEDNHPNRLVATALLRSAGFGIDIVTNGREAVDAAVTGRFDVVLMDVNMPVMDGLEATRLLRATEATRTMPIIGLTANAMTADRQNCLAAGMSEHVSKPIDWDALLALLGRLESEIYGSAASSAA